MKNIIPLPLIAGVIFILSACVSSAQTVETLYATPASPSWRDNYTGGSGCKFTVGVSNVVVSHLGYFCSNSIVGLQTNHYVGVYSASPVKLLAQVIVPAGIGADAYTNEFFWMPLDPPLLLTTNTTYYVAALPYNGDHDLWGDSFTATFNPFFLGANVSTPVTAYGPGNSTWPVTGFSTFGSSSTYCVEGMANLPIDRARVGVQNTNVNIATSQTISVLGFASGQSPISFQWWMAGSPATPIAGQTNGVLMIPNAAAGNSGIYFLTASNALGGEQSPNVTVQVSDDPVGIEQQPTNTTVFENYLATFSLVVTGTPPISLEWFTNGLGILSSATIDPLSLTLSNSYSFYAKYPANNGNVFTAIASNNILSTAYTATSSPVTLTVLPNLAYPQQFLHGAPMTNVFSSNGGTGNPQTGSVGGTVTIGSNTVVVTHLGYCALGLMLNNQAQLTDNHHLSIYNASGTQLLGYTEVTNGTPTNSEVNGYFWAALNPPLILTNNTTYLLAAETFSSGGQAVDPWGDTYVVPDLNSYFASSCEAYYGGSSWPGAPTSGGYPNQMYSGPNMAILAPTNLSAYITPTNLAQVAGTSATLTGIVVGQAPMTLQWCFNGSALPGQTNSTLTFASLQTANEGDYYIVATNYQTSMSVTSAITPVTIYTSPVILNQLPVPYTNLFTLYAGVNPAFSVSATGVLPFYYQWFTNGVAVGAATNATFTMNNVQTGFLTNYCIITNIYGSATTMVWTASVIPSSGLASYPQAVLALNPIDYWRLNDTNLNGVDNGSGDNGFICNDYVNGNNGLYTNADLANGLGILSYDPTADPTAVGANFAYVNQPNSDVNSILAPDFSTPNGSNAEFTIEAWVWPYEAQSTTAGIVAKGLFNEEEFVLDCGAPNESFRFEVRNAAGTVYNANSAISTEAPSQVQTWYHLVGVCDESNGLVSFYINGVLATNLSIPKASGITNSSETPISIGARSSHAPPYTFGQNDQQFAGYISDVAAFNYPLTASQIANEYVAGGGTIAPFFNPAPPTNATANAGGTLTIPVTAIGTPPMSYYWTNVTTATGIATGSTTTSATLNASLNYSNVPFSWNGNQLELTVSNAYGMTNTFVTLALSDINTNPTNIIFAVTNHQLTLSWPADHTGWTLETQTNSLSKGLSTNWSVVGASTSTNKVIIPINLTNGSVFYRLMYP